MLETEFREVSDTLMYLANTEDEAAFAAELETVNRELKAKGEWIDFKGARHAGLFILRELRTNVTIFEYRPSNILNWPNSRLTDLLARR
jgi:hypothetical protein